MESVCVGDYRFLPAERGDAEAVFTLIRKRIQWMDETGIQQWNVEDYWEVFPESYYFSAIAEKRLYVLKNSDSAVAAGVLAFRDRGWEEREDAVYLHNFVTARNARGAGDRFLEEWAALAWRLGKRVLRLDCAEDNERLNRYYEERGFRAVGRVEDGDYTGTRREKILEQKEAIL